MNKTAPLICAKLRSPFIRSELVSRPRLRERVARGLCGPLTLMTAPAGFGKTTLIASEVANLEMPVAWLSLDKHDNPIRRFLNYLVAALQEAHPAIGNEVAPLMAAAQQTPPDIILTHLINDLEALHKDVALVLDDYHVISSQEVHKSVAFLLEHCPKTFHLLIATRSDPPLALARLRARGQMVELRAADLRFTEAEAARFLNDLLGLGLDAGAVAALQERTEGWIAGLQMAALSMRDREDVAGFVAGFSGTNRYILDYLLEEVLAREPEEVQSFLLQTSILNRLTGPLCDAVTGASGGQKMLERLEARNLFVVPLDDNRRWYRYHHLFAELLQARLHQSGTERVAQLLSRAAVWCEAEGQIAEAVDYALAAEDYGQAADLIANYWHHTANTGEIETVWSWLQALPEGTVKKSAPLGLAYCWVLWLRGQIGAMEPHLKDAEHALREQVRAERTSAGEAVYAELPAHLAVLRSILARHDDDFEAAIAYAEHALHLTPEDLPPQANAQLHTVIFLALASAYNGAGELEKAVDAYSQTIRWGRRGANAAGVAGMTHRLIGVLWLLGRLRAAEEACRDALTYLEARGMAHLPPAGILHLRMSELYLERNDLEAAEIHLSRGIELGKWSGRFDAERNAAPALVRLRQARNETSGALVAVREAEAALGERPSALLKAELLALRANVLVRQGTLTEAAQCVEKAACLAGQDRGQTGEQVELAASRVMLAQDKPDEAIEALTQSLAAAEASGRLGVALEMHIIRSLALSRRGESREAEDDLERALALGQPEGYARVFLDEGQPMEMLLAQWLAHAGASPLRDYAVHLLSHFKAEPQGVSDLRIEPPAETLVEPLSERELEVLHIMALGKTNKEIAQQLIIAPGTVKAHTSNIYRKLDVANRTEAVARARQLGILGFRSNSTT